jgi:hypothetical protein
MKSLLAGSIDRLYIQSPPFFEKKKKKRVGKLAPGNSLDAWLMIQVKVRDDLNNHDGRIIFPKGNRPWSFRGYSQKLKTSG